MVRCARPIPHPLQNSFYTMDLSTKFGEIGKDKAVVICLMSTSCLKHSACLGLGTDRTISLIWTTSQDVYARSTCLRGVQYTRLCKVSLLVSVLLLFLHTYLIGKHLWEIMCYFVHNIFIQHSELAFAQTDSLYRFKRNHYRNNLSIQIFV